MPRFLNRFSVFPLTIVETVRVKELSILAMIFIPLTVASGIFSMSGKFAPGGPSFWVYWVVGVSLVLLVLVVAFGLNPGLALVSCWAQKSPFRRRRDSEFLKQAP